MSSNLQNVDERDMVNSHIEALAKKAFRTAYKEALASEGGVTAVVDGVLYQVYKDGTKEKIKDIPARIKLDPNKQYSLKV